MWEAIEIPPAKRAEHTRQIGVARDYNSDSRLFIAWRTALLLNANLMPLVVLMFIAALGRARKRTRCHAVGRKRKPQVSTSRDLGHRFEFVYS
jgi:hypothetical protein